MEFDFQTRSKQCSQSGRDLQPGEVVYSCILSNDEGELTRKDFAAENWDGPPENALGWWKVQLPELDPNKIYWAPNSVILSLFEEITSEEKADLKYVLALLMVRRKILRLEEIERNQDQTETLVLASNKDKTEYLVPVASMSSERVNEIQQELAELLFSHEPPALEDQDLE